MQPTELRTLHLETLEIHLVDRRQCLAHSFSLRVAINTLSPAASMAQYIAQAKEKPGQLQYGTQGVGSAGHLSAQMLQNPIAGQENIFHTKWLRPYWLRPIMMTALATAAGMIPAGMTAAAATSAPVVSGSNAAAQPAFASGSGILSGRVRHHTLLRFITRNFESSFFPAMN